MKKENESSGHIFDEYIDIMALFKSYWEKRKLILGFLFIFTIIGLIYALQQKNSYSASTTFVPVSGGNSIGGSIGGIASLAGFSLGSTNNVGGNIPLELYPEIVSSVPFLVELLDTKIKVAEVDSLVSYKYYYNELQKPNFFQKISKYSIGLPKVIFNLFKNQKKKELLTNNKYSILALSDKDYSLINQLSGQINIEVSRLEGFVTLSVSMPGKEASAQMAQKAQQLLQDYVLKYKTQKSIDQFNFIKARFEERLQDFEDKKLKLALFQDQNNNINSAVARTKLLQLQSEYDLAFNVYSELAKQLETQRLQVKKDTPIFTILKPVTIPNEKDGPNRSLILIVYTFSGFIVSLGYIYVRGLLPDLKKEWVKA